MNDGVDSSRSATLVPSVQRDIYPPAAHQNVSTVVFNGHLSGLTIGTSPTTASCPASLEDGTAVLTIKNLPSSVLTGSSVSRSLLVTCSIEMDVDLLGETTKTARMCVAVL